MASIELQILANITNLQRNLQRGGQAVDNFADQSESKIKKTGSTFTAALGGIGAGIAAAFSVNAIVSFTNSVMKATAESQRLKAVLSNALGSGTLAESYNKQIEGFSAGTPFSADSLTQSFVRLVNQGFIPTIDQMRSLGDIATSTGKTFDQLSDILISAQSGSFRGLRELGISAKDTGNSIVFTFKGVQTQVEKTSSAIREYIIGLGNAEGVSGSMAAVSSTLSGQISGLQANYDQMLGSIGNNTSGAFSTAIAWIDKLITRVKDLNEEIEISNKYGISGDFWARINRALNPFADKGMTDRERSVIGIQATSEWVDEYVKEVNGAAKSTEDFDKAVKSLQTAIDNVRKEDRPFGEINGIVDQYSKGIQALIDLQTKFVENANKPPEAPLGPIKQIENQYKNLYKQLEKLNQSSYLATLEGYNKELQGHKNKIDELKKQATDYYREGALSAKQYSDYVISLQRYEVRERLRILSTAGIGNTWEERQKQIASKWRPWTGQKQPQGLTTGPSTLPVPTIAKTAVVDLTTDPVWDAFVDDLDKQLSRAVQSFGRDFLRTISNINQQENASFASVFSTLTGSISGGIGEVLNTTLTKELSGMFSENLKKMGEGITKGIAGLNIAGSIIQGVTNRTNVAGQTVGGVVQGAASGAGAGGWIGAIVGAVFGGLGSFFGASEAKKQEAIARDQLNEQKKQTALLERANALAYASSIIGQMTSGGFVSGITRDAFGQLVATVKGSDIQFVLQRAGGSR